MGDKELIVGDRDMSPVFDWLEINGPCFLSSASFLLLLVWTQVALPQQTPQSFCVFPSSVSDIFIWLLIPFGAIVICTNVYMSIMRNRQVLGKDVGWAPSFFTVLTTIMLIMMTAATIFYGFSQKFVPLEEREGWVLRQCSVFTMIRFTLIYGVFLFNSLIPLYVYRK